MNDVLIRLRESQVSAVEDTTYSTLIGKFVNDAKREVEDAWNWTSLRTEIAITLTADDSTYDVTGTNRRTRILEVHNTTQDYIIRPLSHVQFQRRSNLGSSQTGSPTWYKVMGFNSSSGEMQIELFPTPSAADTIEFYAVNPLTDFSTDTTVLTVPDDAVVLGAWAKAVSERGEDGGQLFQEADLMYRSALHTAISWDTASIPEEINFHPV